jgi:hypothetical protein
MTRIQIESYCNIVLYCRMNPNPGSQIRIRILNFFLESESMDSHSPKNDPPSSSNTSLWETPGEKPEGSRAAPTNRTDLEPSGVSPGVSQREVRELEGGFKALELHYCTLFITYPAEWLTVTRGWWKAGAMPQAFWELPRAHKEARGNLLRACYFYQDQECWPFAPSFSKIAPT